MEDARKVFDQMFNRDVIVWHLMICGCCKTDDIEESGLNPKTCCGGTPAEMVCPGGEQAFISRIIKDSVQLKQSFRWYTSMVGRKTNLKTLTSKLREVGVTIVTTTEFLQGQTCRWGLAWSFLPPSTNIAKSHVVSNDLSFMLEGIQRQYSAIDILQSAESFFSSVGAFCKSDVALFHINIKASKYHCDVILNNGTLDTVKASSSEYEDNASNVSDGSNSLLDDLHFSHLGLSANTRHIFG